MRKKALKTTKNFFVPKVAQICEISRNFGCFLPGNKDSDPSLEDPDFLSPAKKGQRVGSLNPNPWICNNTKCSAGIGKETRTKQSCATSFKNLTPNRFKMASAVNQNDGGHLCVVVGCNNHSARDRGKCSFFGNPARNLEQRELWIKAVKRVGPDGMDWVPAKWHKV
jgi:hypothetical protein